MLQGVPPRLTQFISGHMSPTAQPSPAAKLEHLLKLPKSPDLSWASIEPNYEFSHSQFAWIPSIFLCKWRYDVLCEQLQWTLCGVIIWSDIIYHHPNHPATIQGLPVEDSMHQGAGLAGSQDFFIPPSLLSASFCHNSSITRKHIYIYKPPICIVFIYICISYKTPTILILMYLHVLIQ